MKREKKSDVTALLHYAGSHKGLTFLAWLCQRYPCC